MIYLAFSGNKVEFKEKASYLDLFAGISFGIAAYAYIISAQVNGVTNAFIYAQQSQGTGRNACRPLCLIVVGAIL